MPRFYPLKLDPGFAVFYGLPAEIPFRFPEDAEPDARPGVDLHRIARALTEAVAEIPGSATAPLHRFLRAWPAIDPLERYLAIGNHTFAHRVARELTTLDQDLPCAHLGAGIAASRLGLLEEAQEALDRVLVFCPERSDALVEMSLVLALRERWDGARLMLDRLERTHPTSADLLLYRPLVERQDGAAILKLRDLTGRLAEAERQGAGEDASAAAEALITAFPETAEASRRAAVALRRAGDHVRAMTLALRAARQDERSPLVLSTLAQFHLEARDHIEAERVALRVRTQAPGWTPAMILLARILRADGRPGMAALHLGEAIAAQPEDRSLQQLHGLCLLEAGRIDEARARFRDIADRDAYDPLSFFNLGRVEEIAGDDAAAADRYRQALERAPRFAEAREALAAARGRSGDPDESRRLLEELIRERPESPFGYRGLGDLLVDSDPAQALAFYEEARRRAPDLPSAGLFYLTGNKLLLERKYSEAGNLFELSLRMNRRRHRSWCNLGVARMEEGRLEEAIVAMEEAVHRAPSEPGYRRNLSVFYGTAFRRNPLRNLRYLWWSVRESRAARRVEISGAAQP